MSYAPARVRSRAPWIAFLLIPLIALATALAPASIASAAPGDIAGATLSWGFKQSFRSYLTGPIAHGHVTGTGVDTATPYGWSGGTGTSASNTVTYPGALQFQGHQGMVTGDPAAYALDITITDVRVKITSAAAGELQADVVSRDMATGELVSYPDTVIASLNLAGGTNASTATSVAYTGVPAALTAAGVPAFAGFYPAGSALDAVSFSWPVEQAPEPEPDYGITVAPATDLADGATVTVTGTFPTTYTATNGSTQNTGVYLMYCVQPAGEPGTGASGRASGAANCNSPSQQWLGQPGAVGGATPIGTVTDGVWTFTSTLALPDSFGTNVCNDAADATKQCGIVVRLDHNSGNGPAATYTYDQFAPVTFAAPVVEPDFGIAVTPSADLADGDTVTVTGTFPASILATAGASAGTALTTGVYLMYCAEPAGEVGTAGGRASGALCDTTKQQYLAAAAGPAGATVTGTVADGIWTFSRTITVADGFGAHECAATTEDAEQCGIFVRLYHGFTAGNVANPYVHDQFVPVTFAAPAAPTPAVTTEITSVSTASGLVVRVDGTQFDGITAAYAAIIEKGTESGVGMEGGYVGEPIEITSITDGAFDATLTAPTAQLDRTKQYEVIVWKTRSAPDATTIYASADIDVTTEQWNVLFPPAVPTVDTTVTAASKADGVTVRAAGSGFDGVTAAYAAIIQKGTEAGVGAEGGYIGEPIEITSIASGGFSATLDAPTAELDRTKVYEVIVWKTRSNPDATTIYARDDINITAAQWNVLFPPVVVTPTPGAGSLTWGVKASFRSYVTGPIAHGSITTSGVGSSTSGYVFPQAGAASFASGLGSVSYSGSVRFSGHAGVLDLRLSDPQVRVDSASSGTLFLRVNGGTRVAFANLALGAGSKSTAADGAVSYSNVPATITAAGSGAFSLEGSSFYPAGTALDPVSFTVGSAGVSLGGTVVTASATRAAAAANTPDATPPATEGITVTGATVEGGEVTAEADGFQPNETGILAVIYSTPTVLAEDLTADANGHVTWTGTLPRGLSGEHTLTFQGSVDRGVVLDITAAAELQCTVSDASLVWGFKESFRAYIDGSIANGEWTTDGGVSYETPLFTWTGGTGGADLDEGALDVQYSGSVRFTGHGGALDTTVANPRVVVDGDTAVLLLDVTGTTQAGEVVAATAVEFAELDLANVEAARDGDTVTWADVPATLSASGAAAFGTYPEGEDLDPVTIVATVDSDCGEAAAEPTAEPTADEIEPEQTSADGWPLWATILIVVVVLLIIAGLVFALVRRNRTAA